MNREDALANIGKRVTYPSAPNNEPIHGVLETVYKGMYGTLKEGTVIFDGRETATFVSLDLLTLEEQPIPVKQDIPSETRRESRCHNCKATFYYNSANTGGGAGIPQTCHGCEILFTPIPPAPEPIRRSHPWCAECEVRHRVHELATPTREEIRENIETLSQALKSGAEYLEYFHDPSDLGECLVHVATELATQSRAFLELLKEGR